MQANPTVVDPNNQPNPTLFENGLQKPVGQVSATYPDEIKPGYNLVVYIESASDLNDLCYSDEWARAKNVPSDYKYKWWLCYYMVKYGYAVEDETTAAILAAASPNMAFGDYLKTVVLPYLSASLGSSYHEYNSCEYIPVASNTNTFTQTLPATKQVDCSATYTNANGRTILTSCDVALFSETDRRTSYFDTRPREWDFLCIRDDGTQMTKRANESYIIAQFYQNYGETFDYCLKRKCSQQIS